MPVAKKGNGMDLANDYLRQIVGKLGAMEVGLDAVRVGLDGVRTEQVAMRREQEAMRKEQAAMRVQMGNIEDGVRQIASFVGQERGRQMQEFEDLKRRVEILEHKAA